MVVMGFKVVGDDIVCIRMVSQSRDVVEIDRSHMRTFWDDFIHFTGNFTTYHHKMNL